MEAVDNAGNIKKSTSITAKTKGELLAPRISLSGEQGENGYYKGNVTVTIEDSASEDITGTNQIKYQVTGSNQIGETTINGRTATFEITIDGTSTITAQAVSKDGNVSETETQTVNKDSTPPTASLTAGTVGETSIEVTATGTDATSGIASYEFQISTTSSTEGFTTKGTITNSNTSNTYTYNSLTAGTTYYLRVIVKDIAGNTEASTVLEQEIEKTQGQILAENIGKYVRYTPTSGSFSSSSTYNGYRSSSYSTSGSTQWRILAADDNTLTLISEEPTNENFYLRGANGYNNCVLLLNNASKALYSNNGLGAVARSIKMEDIEKVSNFQPDKEGSYANEYGKEDSIGDGYYPNIFAQEKTGSVNGGYGSTFDLSEQTDYITGYSHTSLLGGISTHYSYELSTTYMNSIYVELFQTDIDHWVATRCHRISGGFIGYWMFCIDGRWITGEYIYGSYNEYGDVNVNYERALRPIVEIDLSKVVVGETGTGSKTSQYSIRAK